MEHPRRFLPTYSVGLAAGVIALAASASLSASHFGVSTLFGCGAADPCGAAAKSGWSNVAGWPIAHLGVAYFSSLIVVWAMIGRRGSPNWLRWCTRFAAAASLLLVGAMARNGMLCPYCIVVHVGNLVLAAAVELQRGNTTGVTRAPALTAIGVFSTVTAALALTEWAVTSRAHGVRERTAANAIATLADRAATGLSAPAPTAFTGRFRAGPEIARARIVIFSDYQCAPCRRLEDEAAALLAARTDVSVSIKHFPWCTDCNPNATRTIHPDACRAARAAEAAGMIKGPAAFQAVHRWLFARGGSFTDDALAVELERLGFDQGARQSFFAAMNSAVTLELIQRDAAEAKALGLRVTPMVFINGAEFEGWPAQRGLARAVEALANQNIAPATASVDQPITGIARSVQVWASSEVASLPSTTNPWRRGPRDARVRIVVFGNYRGNLASQLEQVLNETVSGRTDVAVEFRNFPMSVGCNPALKKDAQPGDCRLAAVAESAGLVAGEEGFWKLHSWLLRHPQSGRPADDDGIWSATQELGLDTAAVAHRIDDPRIARRIAEDVQTGQTLGLTYAPAIYVNNRRIADWAKPGVLAAIVEQAAARSPPKK